MKPVTASPKTIRDTLKVSPTAKIIAHPLAKPAMDEIYDAPFAPPDEETLIRLNAMAKQYPFCIRHRTRNNHLL